MEHELAHLLTDPSHWQFELITTLVFDALTLLVILPIMRAWKAHHRDDHTEMDDIKKRLSLIENQHGNHKED